VRFVENAAANGAVDEAVDILNMESKALAEPSRRAQSAARSAAAAANHARPADKPEKGKKAEEAQNDAEIIKAAQSALADCGKEIQQARRDYDAVRAAQDRLAADPNEPDACLIVGRWDCFSRGDWDKGLLLLAKGSDPALKPLAAAEIASKPSTPSEKVARGDSWWTLAEKAAGKPRVAMERRADSWYLESLKDLPAGAVRTKVEKRLAQPLASADGRPAAGRPPSAIAPFNDKTARSVQSRWAKFLHVPVMETNSIGMKLVLIPPGEFDMGSGKEFINVETPIFETWERDYQALLAGEEPRHHVRISKPYWMGATLVTQEEDERIVGSNPSTFQGDPKRPVETVSWNDAIDFCKRISELPAEKNAKRRYVLPTEAQWEHACRAGSPYAWYFSPQPGDLPKGFEDKLAGQFAWFSANAAGQSHAVAQKLPNSWGLYDMYGNVWEWCQDWYDLDYYAKSATDDPQGPSGGSGRAIRGGCWHRMRHLCRSATRMGMDAATRQQWIGFRICMLPAE
jgi:formylglycine-generating enzyme required for sulfatase activity